jgi:hypothetical protein
MPRGLGDSIEQSAGSNGWLRGSEDQAFRCWQVVGEELQHSIRREVEIPTGVHFESSDERRRKMVFLHISRRLADIRRARCYVD